MRWALLVLLAGCAAQQRAAVVAPRGPQCAVDETYDGSRCRPLNQQLASLEGGIAKLDSFQAEEAAVMLEQARNEGPYRHAEHVRVYEQLSVAYAYLGDEQKALDAFDVLLTLSPGHAISYTLSPKATFLFEKARANAMARQAPRLRVTWPRDLRVDRPVPLEVEVASDPKGFLSRARIYARKKGAGPYQVTDLSLSPPGTYEKVVLPAMEPGAKGDGALELFVTAYDKTGNEVLLWGSASTPREISLDYVAPRPWYKKWWVWTAIGSAVAVGTGVTVFALTRSPSEDVGVDVSVQ